MSTSEHERPSRRDFLAGATQIAVAGVSCGGVAGALRLAYPSVAAQGERQVALGTPADFKMGTLTFLGRHELFVLHEREGFAALSARCTHLGCLVRYDAEGFGCPCHGATFDRLGAVLSGPARAPLAWARVWQDHEGRLWADRATTVPAGTFSRGA